VERVLELTKGVGVDKGCECVAYQAHDPLGREQPSATMNDLFRCVCATGAIGVVGVFATEDPKSPDVLARSGKLAIDWGLFFEKGLRVGSGQTNVKAYNRRLCALINKGIARPSFVVSHELPLEEAPRAYRQFDARDEGWTKVVLNPAA